MDTWSEDDLTNLKGYTDWKAITCDLLSMSVGRFLSTKVECSQNCSSLEVT